MSTVDENHIGLAECLGWRKIWFDSEAVDDSGWLESIFSSCAIRLMLPIGSSESALNTNIPVKLSWYRLKFQYYLNFLHINIFMVKNIKNINKSKTYMQHSNGGNFLRLAPWNWQNFVEINRTKAFRYHFAILRNNWVNLPDLILAV